MTTFWNVLVGVLSTTSIMILLVYLAYRSLRPEQDEKSKETSKAYTGTEQKKRKTGWSYWIKHPATLITAGVTIFNLVSWSMISWWWNILTYTWWGFIVFNLGVWTILYLQTLKAKDKNGEDTDKNHPIASKIAKGIGVALAVGILTIAGDKIQTYWEKRSTEGGVGSRTYATNLSHSVPMEVALRVIAECESGGKQFEPDGKTPLKNKGIPDKGIKPSGAFGKYQFLESHREPALKLGFDLNTEDGQDNYARYRYSQTGTKDWEFDEQYGGGRVCWEPKLRAYTWGGGEAVTITVVAPIDKWSDLIPLPRTGDRGGKTTIDEGRKKISIKWNDEIEEEVPRPEGVAQKNPPVVYSFRVKSRETEPVNVIVKFF